MLRSRSRFAITTLAFLVGCLSVLAGVAAPPSARATTPGSPGSPQPGTQFYQEDFSNVSAAAAPVGISGYTGGAAAKNEIYYSDPQWRETAQDCNGWILRSTSPRPTAAQDPGCQTQAWPNLQGLAYFMGQYQGMASAAAAANQAVADFTYVKDPGAGVELESQRPMAAQAGHYYAVSAIYAATSCRAPGNTYVDPSLTFSLLINGVPRILSSGLNPCTDPARRTFSGTFGSANLAVTGTVSELQSAAIQVPTTGTPTLGFRLYNATSVSWGNDHAFDLPRIVDVTPQLDKSFTPATIAAGGTSRVTFTITNTDELQAKNGWTFSDNLPAGLKVASPSSASTTCPSGVVTAAAGGSTISVTGNLSLNMASCTASVDVTAASAGTYTNGPANITSNGGLNPPGDATLTVVNTDFGDAPLSYGTDTASHTATAGLRIGSARDSEVSAAVSAGATGDDSAGTDDEDGITGTPFFRTDQPMTQQVAVTNTTGSPGTLVGWIDFNRDGDFSDAGEQSASVVVPSGATSASVTWPAQSATSSGSSFIRLRFYPGAPAPVSPTAPATGGEIEDHPVTLGLGALDLTKTAGPVNDLDGNGPDAGDTVTYTLTVTNTGTLALDPVTVNDPLLGGAIACGTGTLAAGASRTCTSPTYTLTQADVDSGGRGNTATAVGTPPTGPSVSDTASTLTPIPPTSSISLVKSVNRSQLVAGQSATYTLKATNTGTVTLSGVTISETSFSGSGTMSGLSCTPSQPATLAPGATLTCTATYTVTQADVDRGSLSNTASATGTPPGGPAVTDTDDANVPATATPALQLDKKVTSLVDVNQNQLRDVGDKISYAFDVTNTGNVTIQAPAVHDPLLEAAGISVTCPATSIAPGAQITCTADAAYVITQADVDSGAVTNTATSTGTPPSGPPVTTPPDETITPTDRVPGIRLVKSANRTDLVAGQTVTYTMTATNTGTVTLTGVQISDSSFTGSGSLSALSCVPVQPATLTPGAALTCTATYVVTQADVDRGSLGNTASVTGTPPTGPAVTDTDDATVPGTSTPALTLDKRVTSVVDVNQNQATDAGDEIRYAFDLTNAGNVTLTGYSVTDDLLGSAGIAVTCPATSLAPGASVTCTADAPYVITQADVDAGGVHNTATGSGAPPSGPPTTSPPDETITPTDQVSGITLAKSADLDELVVGSTATYTMTATNTGTTTLSAVRISETSFTGSGALSPLSCTPSQPATLAPGAALVCTATYVVTQADVDQGSVDNRATATGTPPTGPAVTDTDDATVPSNPAPALELDKRVTAVTDANQNALTDVGDTISYAFDVKNTGNVTIQAPEVDDPLLQAAGISVTCPATSIAPGAQITCTADAAYVITQADVDSGAVTNTATSTGTPPSGPQVTTPPDDTITPTDRAPGIQLTKSANRTDLVAGQTVTYTMTATNTGTVTLTGVQISESSFTGAGDLSPLSCTPSQPATLAPRATLVCTATYVVTQADVDRGSVENLAAATGTPPTGPAVTDTDSTTVPTDPAPELELAKRVGSVADVNQNQVTDAGDEISYVFDLTNTGNVTLTSLGIDDDLLQAAGIPVSCSPTTLAPQDTVTCTADAPYVITQADVDAGGVRNSATSTGTPPSGPPVDSPPDETLTPTDQDSDIALVKSTDLTELVVGRTATYTMTATNTGTVTLAGVQISETAFTGSGALSPLSCTPSQPATLAPGATLVCTATYVVTQADVDQGSVDNRATATGTPPSGPPVTDTDGATVPSDPAPALEIEKRVSAVVDVNENALTDAGDRISYAFDLTNTGNVTLTDLGVDDDLLEAAGISVTCPSTLAPGATVTCTADRAYVITQADVDAGEVENTATSTGSPPSGPPVDSPPDVVTTPTDRVPGISVVKSVDRSRLVAGQTATYTITATNTGTTTLSGVTISETAFTGAGSEPSLSCTPSQPATLAPDARLVCTGTYVVTQADVDQGSVANTASATGTPPVGAAVTDSDDATIPSVPDPRLRLDKRVSSVTDVNHDELTDVGDEITYVFDLTNTGNVTLTDLEVDDDLLDAAGISVTCSPTTLAPAGKVTCTADRPYVITQADVDAGGVENSAAASSSPPSGPSVDSPPDETLTPTDRVPGIELDKRVESTTDHDGDGRLDVGDELLYAFDVTNTGTVTLHDPEVTDDRLAKLGISVSCSTSDLDPGETVTCTADEPYVVTQKDVDAGQVLNAATATADGPEGTDPPTDTDTEITRIDPPPLSPQAPEGGPSGVLPSTGAPAHLQGLGLLGLLLVGLGAWMVRPTRIRQGRAR